MTNSDLMDNYTIQTKVKNEKFETLGIREFDIVKRW